MRGWLLAVSALLFCAPAWAQNDRALEAVLTDLDNSATKFRTCSK